MRRPVLALLFAPVLFLASCGDDDEAQVATPTVDDSVQVVSGEPKEIAERISSCLDVAGYRTLLMPTPANQRESDAPDFGLAFQAREGEDLDQGGQVAVYETEAEAAEKRAAIEENFDGEVEPHGLVTLVYFGEPPEDVRADVLGCL